MKGGISGEDECMDGVDEWMDVWVEGRIYGWVD